MPRRRLLEVLLARVAAAAAAAWLMRPPAPPPAEQGSIPLQGLSIMGVRPGMTRAHVEAVKGPGRVLWVVKGVETTA